MLHIRPGSFWEHARLFFGRVFGVVGISATLLTLYPLFVENGAQVLLDYGCPILLSVATLAAVAGLLRLFQPSRLEFTAAGSRLKIEIKQGDLFAETGNLAIPVNDFFDTELGQPVSPESVHGKFVQKFFDGNAADARKAFDGALRAAKASGQVDPSAGKRNVRYALGQTCAVDIGGRTAVLLALATADAESRQVSVSLGQYVGALTELWRGVRACCNNQAISVPLMGGGAARTNLQPHQLAELILMTAVREHHKQAIASKIVLVLRKEDLAMVDLFQLKRRYG